MTGKEQQGRPSSAAPAVAAPAIELVGISKAFGPVQANKDIAIRVIDPALDRKLILSPRLAFAEAYMDGGIVMEQGEIGEVVEANEERNNVSMDSEELHYNDNVLI